MAMLLVLAFGLATVVSAAWFAYRPEGRSPAPIWSLAIATATTTTTGVCADLAAVGHHAPRFLREHPDWSLPSLLLQGFAESMAPGILGFTLISLGALLISVGLWRRAPG